MTREDFKMTREEAKIWLNTLYMRADITDEYGDMEDMQPYEEAVNMAIQALEQEPYVVNTKDLSDDEIKKFEEVMKNVRVQVIQQEPCEDVISRKDALEPYKILKDTDTLCVALIRANIMQQPSVKQDTVPFDIELYQAGLMDMPKEMIEVLNKIRAEIEHVIDNTYDSTDHDKSLYNGAYKDGLYDALDIIDKYNTEMEVKE